MPTDNRNTRRAPWCGGSFAAGATPRRSIELILATITIVLSWAFIHTMFALHYAHECYAESGVRGMAFPGGEEEPDYWDFVYFWLVIGMTSQVSDVGITTKEIPAPMKGAPSPRSVPLLRCS